MKIERIEEMRLSKRDDKAIGSLLDGSFGVDYGTRSFFQQRHHIRLLMRQKAAVIGHMGITIRAIRMGDKLLTIAGLGDVATDISYRGQGIATQLLHHAIKEVKSSQCAFFLLFGNRPLYAASGFKSVPNKVRCTSLIGVKTGEVIELSDSELMVMPLGSILWDEATMIDLVGHAF